MYSTAVSLNKKYTLSPYSIDFTKFGSERENTNKFQYIAIKIACHTESTV